MNPPITIEELSAYLIMWYETYFGTRISSRMMGFLVFQVLYIWSQIDEEYTLTWYEISEITKRYNGVISHNYMGKYNTKEYWKKQLKSFVLGRSDFYKVFEFVFTTFKNLTPEEAQSRVKIWWEKTKENPPGK